MYGGVGSGSGISKILVILGKNILRAVALTSAFGGTQIPKKNKSI